MLLLLRRQKSLNVNVILYIVIVIFVLTQYNQYNVFFVSQIEYFCWPLSMLSCLDNFL